MAMAVGPAASPTDGAAPVLGPAMMHMQMPMPAPAPVAMVSDAMAKDAIIGWYRGEFAAANAIIDSLCGHLTQLSGGGAEYGAVFAAIHRRRINWIPVLQMQKYHSIADVMVELRNVGAKKAEKESEENGEVSGTDENCKSEEAKSCLDEEKEKENEKVEESNGNDAADEAIEEEASPDSEITDSGK